MSEGINYNSRTFDEYREQFKLFTQRYYPEILNDFQDAAIGKWFIDLISGVGDNLGYYIDRMYQETQIDYAQERKSLLSIARTNGLKIVGKRPSMLEAEWSCWLPVDSVNYGPDWSYAPTILRGSQANGGGQKFELNNDLKFSEQFNSSGLSDRTIVPLRTTNGALDGYTVTKKCIMTNGESKIFTQTITSSDITPFMEIVLPETNVIKIHSIVIKNSLQVSTPTVLEFMSNSATNRWYEVNNLLDDKFFMKDNAKSNTFRNKIITDLQNNSTYLTSVELQGENTYCGKTNDNSTIYGYLPNIASWVSNKQKFTTEYTDNGYCKIIFGSGLNGLDIDPSSFYNASSFNQYQLNKIINNYYLGELPPANSTIYVYYSVGGGKNSNIGLSSMKNISYLNANILGLSETTNSKIRSSIKVTNTTPSVSGRDELTNDEIRYLIKYNNAAQDRCVTLKDYEHRILTMPSEFGAPLKLCASEKNNKILITMLGLDYDGTLSPNLSKSLIENISTYLSEYKMINDYVEIQPGKIINLQFEIDVSVEDNTPKQDVIRDILLYIGDYMDINNHKMGDDVFISKIKSDVAAIKGVKNLIDIRVYNIYANGYSKNIIKQATINEVIENKRLQVDLITSDGVLYSEYDTMFEIKKPTKDILVRIKSK